MIIFNYLLILVVNILITLVINYKGRIKILEKKNDEIWSRYFNVINFLNHNLNDEQKQKFDNYLDKGIYLK